jgi:hypothetical protein
MKIQNVKLKVVGVTFQNEDGTNRQTIIGQMKDNAPVTLIREPSNRFDKNAVAVYFVDQQIGYIGREYAKIIAIMMDSGRKFDAKVLEVGRYEGTNYIHIIVSEV